MKKLSLLFCVIFSISSCAQDNIVTEDEDLNIDLAYIAKKGDKEAKIDLCHKGKIINVSVNALSSHRGHGDAIDLDGDGYFDLENDCSDTDFDDTIPFDQSTLVDNDGDGFFPIENPFSEVDCNDTNALINVSVEEICNNGIDDNCDGNVDENCRTTLTCDVCNDESFCSTLDPINISCYYYSGEENTLNILYSEGFEFEINKSENTDCYNFVLEFLEKNNIRGCYN